MLARLLTLFVCEASAAKLLGEVRLVKGVRCTYCSSEAIIRWAWCRHVYQRYRCKVCLRTFNDKTWTISAYPRIPLNEWLLLAYLLGCLHISILKASREIEHSYGIAYRSARKIMYAIHGYCGNSGRSRKTSGIIEMDEAYITASLKRRGSHDRILRLGRESRRRGLKAKPGRILWKDDKLPIFILVERGELPLYIPSIDVRGETIGRIA